MEKVTIGELTKEILKLNKTICFEKIDDDEVKRILNIIKQDLIKIGQIEADKFFLLEQKRADRAKKKYGVR